MSIQQPGEDLLLFHELDEETQRFVVLAHAVPLKATNKLEKLLRLFNLGNPQIIIGGKGLDRYCRVAPESVSVMTIITKSYLK
jgi:hypothetical protein